MDANQVENVFFRRKNWKNVGFQWLVQLFFIFSFMHNKNQLLLYENLVVFLKILIFSTVIRYLDRNLMYDNL